MMGGNLWTSKLPAIVAALMLVFTSTYATSSPRRVSVSGQSAGGSMAMNHLFAFSASVDGAAIAAGSPYGCGSLRHKTNRCAYDGQAGRMKINVPQLNKYARWRQAQGMIDDLSNLRDTPVLLFNGNNDWEVYVSVMRDAATQMRSFVNSSNLETVFNTNAAHVWSIDHGRCHCGECGIFTPRQKNETVLCCDVNNCKYDLSGDMFRRIYGSGVKPRQKAKSSLHFVEQSRYIPAAGTGRPHHRASVMQYGLVYIPTGCEAKPSSCRLHINYHGCMYKRWWKRREWSNTIDLNEYGEANNIIILYPQAAGDKRTGIGCWNWGGFGDDKYFDTKESLQIQMVVNMVEDIDNAIANYSVSVRNADPVPPPVLADEDGDDDAAGEAIPPGLFPSWSRSHSSRVNCHQYRNDKEKCVAAGCQWRGAGIGPPFCCAKGTTEPAC